MSLISFQIVGETPAKKNSRLTLPNGRSIPSKRYREWHADAESQIIEQWVEFLKSGVEKINRPIKLSLYFVHKDARRMDSDNAASSILDLLQDCGVLEDDCWQIVRAINIRNLKGTSARCNILIMDYEEQENDRRIS